MTTLLVAHADSSRVSKVFSGVCDSVSITELGTGIVRLNTSPTIECYVKSHRVTKCKKAIKWLVQSIKYPSSSCYYHIIHTDC